MAGHGGSRSRSGPPPDPGSARSLKRDYKAIALPREGFKGRVPAWPLTKATPRERTVWKEVWRTPQAAAWILEPWRWRTVAQYVRWSVRMEAPTAIASLGAVVMRLQDQIGLSPSGLALNGWQVSGAAVAEPAASTDRPQLRAVGPSARERIGVAGVDAPLDSVWEGEGRPTAKERFGYRARFMATPDGEAPPPSTDEGA